MTRKQTYIFPLIAGLAVSACAQISEPQIDASRAESNALMFFNDPVTQGPVVDQMNALREASDQLVKASSVNGAMIGAAVGCGVTVLSGSNLRNCVTRAAIVGAGGAVIGNAAGEQEVARRVELVDPNAVARRLNTATSQLQSIKTALPQLLAAQEAELNSLTMQLITGQIDQRTHDRAVRAIEQERIDLAEALSLSARDARRASNNLQDAQRRGQTGLEWHIGAATRLSQDVGSTRSTISMLDL